MTPSAVRLTAVFFTYLLACAARPRLSRRRRVLGLLLCAGILLGVAGLSRAPVPDRIALWLPGLYLLLAYWLSALFGAGHAVGLETVLANLDRRWLGNRRLDLTGSPALRTFWQILELAYLACYLLIPGGLVALRLSTDISPDRFWTTVLLAVLPCYALHPWWRTRPPRGRLGPGTPAPTGVRRVNLLVARRASIGWNTFPSGHVAAVVAVALMAAQTSAPLGAAFWVAAILVIGGAIAGHYHYGLDAVLGVVLGGLASIAGSRLT